MQNYSYPMEIFMVIMTISLTKGLFYPLVLLKKDFLSFFSDFFFNFVQFKIKNLKQ